MTREEMNEYKDLIMTCCLFKGLSDQELMAFLEQDGCQLAFYDKNETLASGYLYIVIRGSIRIEKEASDGRTVVMNTVNPCSPVNVTSVLNEKKEQLSLLKAEKGSICLQADAESVRAGIMRGGRFALNITEFLSDRIIFLNKKITSFAGYSADRRLNMYLLDNSRNGEVMLPSSLTEFAGFLGVGRASLYRALDSMEASGIINREKRKITILDPDKLTGN